MPWETWEDTADSSEAVSRQETLTWVKDQLTEEVKTMMNSHKAQVDYQLKMIAANQEYHIDRIEANLESSQAKLLDDTHAKLIESAEVKLAKLLDDTAKYLESARAQFLEGAQAELIEASQAKILESARDKLLEDAEAELVESAEAKILESVQAADRVLAEVTCGAAVDKQNVQEAMSDMMELCGSLQKDMEEARAANVAGQADVSSQLTDLRKDMEAHLQSTIATVGQMSKVDAQLLDLRKEFEELQSKQSEVPSFPQVAGLQKDMDVHSQNAAEQMKQLISLRRDVDDLQSKQSEGRLSQATAEQDVEVQSQEPAVEELSKLTGEVESQLSKLTREVDGLESQLSKLTRQVEDLHSNQTEGRLSQITAMLLTMQKDTEEHFQNAAGGMSSLASQLSSLKREVQDLQNQVNPTERQLLPKVKALEEDVSVLEKYVEVHHQKAAGQTSNLAAQPCVAKWNPPSPRKSDIDYYSEYVSMEKHAADVEKMRQVWSSKTEELNRQINQPAVEALTPRQTLTPIPEELSSQSNDLAGEVMAGLQSRLKKANSLLVRASSPVRNSSSRQENEEKAAEGKSGANVLQPHCSVVLPFPTVGIDPNQAGSQLAGLQRLQNLDVLGGYPPSQLPPPGAPTAAKEQSLWDQALQGTAAVGA